MNQTNEAEHLNESRSFVLVVEELFTFSNWLTSVLFFTDGRVNEGGRL